MHTKTYASMSSLSSLSSATAFIKLPDDYHKYDDRNVLYKYVIYAGIGQNKGNTLYFR